MLFHINMLPTTYPYQYEKTYYRCLTGSDWVWWWIFVFFPLITPG